MNNEKQPADPAPGGEVQRLRTALSTVTSELDLCWRSMERRGIRMGVGDSVVQALSNARAALSSTPAAVPSAEAAAEAIAMRAAFDAGFASSIEGYNGEYPEGVQTTKEYAKIRANALAALFLTSAALTAQKETE